MGVSTIEMSSKSSWCFRDGLVDGVSWRLSLGGCLLAPISVRLTCGEGRSGRGFSSTYRESASVAESLPCCRSPSTEEVAVSLGLFVDEGFDLTVRFVRAMMELASLWCAEIPVMSRETPCHVVRPRQKCCPSSVLTKSGRVLGGKQHPSTARHS